MRRRGVTRRAALTLAWIGGIGLTFGSGCRVGDDLVPFVIAVDSIVASPTTIQDGSALHLTFYGTMGPDLCWMFDHIDSARTNSLYDATFHGRHVVRSGCPQTISLLQQEVTLGPPFNDPFIVRVHQPNGSLLELQLTH